MTEIYELLAQGGILMIPILACSIVGFAFFLERLWSLQRGRILPPGFVRVVQRALAERRFEEAEALCRDSRTPIAAILAAGLRYVGSDRAVVKEAMEEAGQRELHYMERFVNALGAIATVAPLLGLLGTVTGMISVFQRVVDQAATSGATDAAALAGGIWEALITTAAGLAVAIPTYLAFRYIIGRIDRFGVELEEVSSAALDYIAPPPQAPARQASPEPSPEASDAPAARSLEEAS